MFIFNFSLPELFICTQPNTLSVPFIPADAELGAAQPGN